MPAAQRRLHTEASTIPLTIASAQGSTLVDEAGREYLDLTSGWCVANLGWSHPDIERRLCRFEGPTYVPPRYEYAPWAELAARLVAIAPGRLGRACRATGGSEAVDIALQAAMRATKRRRFVALEGCYHGDTLATLTLAGAAPKPLFGVSRLKPPLDERALARLETLLKRRDVAALVMEPIALSLGVEVPTAGFMEGAARLCRRYGTLLVLDEVATGFGRTGTLFAAERYGVEPDILCLAKGITSGHAPMGATLLTDALAKKVGDDLEAYSTYGWHPRAVEAALATLDVWKRDGARLLRNAEERGEQLHAGLEALELGEVRRAGLALAVEMRSGKAAQRLAERAREEGVLLAASDRLVQLFPPLVLTKDEAEQALVAIERATTTRSQQTKRPRRDARA